MRSADDEDVYEIHLRSVGRLASALAAVALILATACSNPDGADISVGAAAEAGSAPTTPATGLLGAVVQEVAGAGSVGGLSADEAGDGQSAEIDLDYRPRIAGFFHRLHGEGDVITIRSGPGLEFPSTGTQPGASLIMHAGTIATRVSGDEWINIADPASKVEIGWVLRDLVGRRMKTIAAHAPDGTAPLTSHPGGWQVGVDIEPPRIVGLGCDAVQIEVRSAASHSELSSHFVFGTEPPTTPRSDWEQPDWDLGDGQQTFFIPPGESVTLTVPARRKPTYYFVALDASGSAPAAFDFANEPILSPDGDLTPETSHELTVQAACPTR